ncbi:hypothetical protein G3N58_07095 [Paraburkholderia sp. Ac-20342]|uniref:hypothetical protein n=1 Tax=Paraburkholderia sp. Ac-20342 TaxID=2703889 RepID=UPI00197E5DCA|nr:hypothetical protein [Paraburkholderia sp. Ac-20342]MBN3846594.1 hypothetical protein [Paraburkholderia sp. Ac-20342]
MLQKTGILQIAYGRFIHPSALHLSLLPESLHFAQMSAGTIDKVLKASGIRRKLVKRFREKPRAFSIISFVRSANVELHDVKRRSAFRIQGPQRVA